MKIHHGTHEFLKIRVSLKSVLVLISLFSVFWAGMFCLLMAWFFRRLGWLWSIFGFLFTGPSLKPQQPSGEGHEICHDSSREECGCLGVFPAVLLWKLFYCVVFIGSGQRRKQAKDLWCAIRGVVSPGGHRLHPNRAPFVSLLPGGPYPDLAQVLPIFFSWSVAFQSFAHVSAFLSSGGSLPGIKWSIRDLPQFGPELRDRKSSGCFLFDVVVMYTLLLIDF